MHMKSMRNYLPNNNISNNYSNINHPLQKRARTKNTRIVNEKG